MGTRSTVSDSRTFLAGSVRNSCTGRVPGETAASSPKYPARRQRARLFARAHPPTPTAVPPHSTLCSTANSNVAGEKEQSLGVWAGGAKGGVASPYGALSPSSPFPSPGGGRRASRPARSVPYGKGGGAQLEGTFPGFRGRRVMSRQLPSLPRYLPRKAARGFSERSAKARARARTGTIVYRYAQVRR